jgi:hypothetical protein
MIGSRIELFWTEIWHEELDDGHRNITRSKEIFLKIIGSLGFEVDDDSIFSETSYDIGFVARKL